MVKKKQLSKPSIRQRIKEEIVRMIASQMMLPGDKILSQNALAELFTTTPVTIHKALTELAQEGFIERRKGVGTFVANKPTSASSGEKRVCLVLHREGLERPEVNPLYWPYVQELIYEFSHQLPEGYTFSLKFADQNCNVPWLISQLKGYHAVFFHYSNEIPAKIIQSVVRSRVAPVVRFGKMHDTIECLYLDNDRCEGVRQGTSYLIDLGHRSIAYVAAKQWWGDLGLAGYRMALSNAGLREHMILRIEVGRQGGEEAAARLLESGPLPDAIMLDSDLQALGLIEHFRQKGLRIPQDVSVMSYDGLQFSTHHPPYLSAVKVPYGEMIAAAMAEIDAAQGRILSNKVLSFRGRIVPGLTTAEKGGKGTGGGKEK